MSAPKAEELFQNYDVIALNPYGPKLGTRQLNPGGAFDATSIAIRAGQQLADHTTPKPAILLTIEGEATFFAGDESITLLPGVVVHIPVATPHRIEARKDSHFVLMR